MTYFIRNEQDWVAVAWTITIFCINDYKLELVLTLATPGNKQVLTNLPSM